MLGAGRFEGGIVPKLVAAVRAARGGVRADDRRHRGGRVRLVPGAVVRATARDRVLPTYARADVTIVRGEGCRVWDDEGRSYLDFGGGIAVTSLGHVHPAVTAAAHEQLDRLWHASNLYWTEPMLRLASLLSDRLGGGAGVLLQLGRRGERGGDQVRAQGDRPRRGSSRSRAASTAARSARSR